MILCSCFDNKPWTRPIPKCINDTINRPDYVSSKATYIIEVGGEVTNDEPCFIYWVEYLGSATINDKVYPYIKKILVYYSKHEIDTMYLENPDIRNGKIKIDDQKAYITPVSNGDGLHEISIVNGKDTIKVHESYGFGKDERISSFKFDKELNKMRFNGYRECSITVENGEITLHYEGDIKYKLSKDCKLEDVKTENMCYMDDDNGKIYFLERDCFIEPVNPEDWYSSLY
ncbi:hypothetical protein D0T60_08785 [Bacteroides sp. 224]|nr:hypothetical protein [Bacteroides sp. 224]